ncbi:hypothetical protein HPP92_028062 [Vanilla planifolia]|uniref:AB hydrolase-1 domain-containing protein n=1 Tax=Vanilla planifolia TaxID=51239 RepID=A0A835U3B1_VANPL|nr:hypothetical protein HPP92_028062 [Vanilla planifolia]
MGPAFTAQTEAWFIDSFEESKAKPNEIHFTWTFLCGYISAKYALKSNMKGTIVNHLWESNFTPQKVIIRYTSARFGSYSSGTVLGEDEVRLLTDWMSYQGAQLARQEMEVPCDIIRVPQGGHFVFIDNPTGFTRQCLCLPEVSFRRRRRGR